MEWISVKDKLPKTDALVIVNIENCYAAKNFVITARYTYWSTKRWLVGTKDKVTHWMPLPNPIQEVDNDI